ncbi:hypothetical protein KUCAC02_033263 [Chaenocephalus aceratus]|nr:hypothetical protein KUCAC02_033263 [Chaenocephalus aceratus]
MFVSVLQTCDCMPMDITAISILTRPHPTSPVSSGFKLKHFLRDNETMSDFLLRNASMSRRRASDPRRRRQPGEGEDI